MVYIYIYIFYSGNGILNIVDKMFDSSMFCIINITRFISYFYDTSNIHIYISILNVFMFHALSYTIWYPLPQI